MAVRQRVPAPGQVPVPVFAATGADCWGPVQELRAAPEVQLVPTPRHAAVLLVAGTVPDHHVDALRRVHDQLPHPRTAVGWRRGGGAGGIPTVGDVDGSSDVLVSELRAALARLLQEPSTSADDLLPDEDPNEWRGVGPFGQGGEGMMGGTPYGRPMAMTGDDRDGLALDQLHLSLGPFLDAFPPGLVLDVVLQGEVVQQATPHLSVDGYWTDRSLPRDPSLADARHGLRWLAHALHVAGLDALAARAAALASRTTDGVDRAALAARVVALYRHVTRSGLLRGLRGVGRTATPGDVAGRWRGRMHAITAALEGHETVDPDADGPPDAEAVLERQLPGMTWTAALSVIVSTDLTGPRHAAPAVGR